MILQKLEVKLTLSLAVLCFILSYIFYPKSRRNSRRLLSLILNKRNPYHQTVNRVREA